MTQEQISPRGERLLPSGEQVLPNGELVLRTLAMPADTNANGDICSWVISAYYLKL